MHVGDWCCDSQPGPALPCARFVTNSPCGTGSGVCPICDQILQSGASPCRTAARAPWLKSPRRSALQINAEHCKYITYVCGPGGLTPYAGSNPAPSTILNS